MKDVEPSQVPVREGHLREGHGFARIQGSSEVFPDNLTGSINLHRLEEVGHPTSPLVLEPGKLLQANRGLLIVDEIGKLPLGTQNVLLQALQESTVSPAKSRETFPAGFVAICTSNLSDLDNINEPLSDRLQNVFVGFNREHQKNRLIVDQALRGRRMSSRYPDILLEAGVYLVTTGIAWAPAQGFSFTSLYKNGVEEFVHMLRYYLCVISAQMVVNFDNRNSTGSFESKIKRLP